MLSCAQTESNAKQALSQLWGIDGAGEFPDENMQGNSETTLHAATLDIVLKSLIETSERFPSLRNQVERTLLKWNYCDVYQKGSFYDLKKSRNGFERMKAASHSPANWSGFKALGFLGEIESRFIPNILDVDQQSLRPDYEQLFHRIFREQCFPHPDTSALFDSTQYRSKERVAATIEATVSEYPHVWDPECVYPQQAPKLATSVLIDGALLAMSEPGPLPASQLVAVPMLKSTINIQAVPQLVPGLETKISIQDIPQQVPSLNTKVVMSQIARKVPDLNTKIVMSQVAQKVPSLNTKVVISQRALKVPGLKSRLLLEPTGFAAPKLSTRVYIDKPKVIAKKKVPVGRRGNHKGNYTGNYRKDNSRHVNTQHVAQRKVVTKPNIVLDKNASLIERVLGGLSGGGNVLIVDKIQLTVNEYNGTVETAISSSDVGTTLSSTETKSELVRELIQALPTYRKPAVTQANHSAITMRPNKSISQSSPYVVVPELQSMVLVSQVETTGRRKPVQIRDKNKRVAKRSPKTSIVSNRNKSAKRNKKDSTSYSLFTYEPYPNKKPEEKSFEELLIEYQAYEARRKSGAKPKKKSVVRSIKKPVVRSINKRLDVPKLNPQVMFVRAVSKKRDVPPLWTEYWIEETAQESVKVPRLNSKGRIYKKYKTRPMKVPSISPMVIQLPTAVKKDIQEPKESFDFSDDYIKDEVFEDTLIKVRPSQTSRLPDKRLPDEAFENTIVQGKALGETFSFSNDRFPDHIFESTLVTDSAMSPVTKPVKPKKKSIGLAGNVYLKQSLKNSTQAIGGSINRKLIKGSHWFARVGWNYTLEESDDPFTYSWGIGYSDWHPGTFSAQLNNWGPIKPGEGLALEKAVANFGYSVKSAFLKKHGLSLSSAINVPVKGNSSIVGNLRWSPKKNWYVNASVSQPLEGGGAPKWTYGFGYSDWRPNKINLQYSNYGPNEILDHNYKENGTWSLSYNWKF